MDLGAVDYGCECLELRSIPVMPICDPHKSLPEKILLKVYVNGQRKHQCFAYSIFGILRLAPVFSPTFPQLVFLWAGLKTKLVGKCNGSHNVAHSQNSEYVISA